MKPFSEACEQNKDPILDVLRREFAGLTSVLEIGSGTGQHAVYFGQHLPHLLWQTSDRPEHHAGIESWITEAGLSNIRLPVVLDVATEHWPINSVEGVFSANTVHIMAWREVVKMFAGIERILPPGGVLCLYGPFNYNDAYTSDSNARFDAWLKIRDPCSGIRDAEKVDALAREQGLHLLNDYSMPANNHMLVWTRTG